MSDAIEIETLHNLAAQMGGDQVLNRVIAMYLDKLPGEMEELESALESGDLETVRSSAHRIKSSTGQLGATNLAALLADLEQAAIQGNQAQAQETFSQAKAEATRVEEALTAHITDP